MKLLYRRGMFFFFSLLISQFVISQTSTITGKVFSDESKTPLEGAVITIKGQRQAVVADKNGAFALIAKQPNNTLVVSHAGFELQELKVTGNSDITVILKSDAKQLEDVVITGYSTQNKR